MNFNIVIGHYYPSDSCIHKLDPRTKLLSTFIFTMLLFLINNIFGYILSALFLLILVKVSKIPIKFLLKGLKSLFGIIIFTVLLNMFFINNGTVIFKIWKLNITMEGIIVAIKMMSRFIMLLVSSSLLTLTTTPMDLTKAIESLLNIFKKFGVPSHEIAMMMTIALRFIPTILEEANKIINAQLSRGSDFQTGNIIKRIKSMIPVLIPLFVSSFRRADELAMAMEARCYRGDINRTKFKELRYTKLDYLFMILFLLSSLVIIFTRFIDIT